MTYSISAFCLPRIPSRHFKVRVCWVSVRRLEYGHIEYILHIITYLNGFIKDYFIHIIPVLCKG